MAVFLCLSATLRGQGVKASFPRKGIKDKKMENINFTNLYQQFLVKVLGEKINAKLTAQGKPSVDASDAMAVMMNINVLFNEGDILEFGAPTGEKFKYLSKEDKSLLLRIIAPTAYIDSNCEWSEMTDVEGKPAVKVLKSWAYVFYDRADSKPVAKYQKTWTLERLLGKNFASTTLEERANAEALARGLCETRVLSRFGLGCWFGSEKDPEAQLIENDNELGGNNIKVVMPEESVATTTPSFTDMLPGDNVPDEVPFEAVINPPVAETAPEAVAEPEEKPKKARKAKIEAPVETAAPAIPEAPTEVASDDAITLTLDEAREVKATVGLAASKGFTLGNIADDEKMKRGNLRYIYTHSHNPREKAAIKVLALNDTVIKASFDEGGISLS